MPSSRASEGEQRPDAQAPAAQPTPGGPTPPTEQAPAAERVSAEELRERVVELEDRWKRALADLDNYRKRAQREIEWRVLEVRQALLRDWLRALDDVERALKMGSPDEPLYEGLRALLDDFERALERHGVTRLGAAGERFDPERHEVIAVVETRNAPDRTVLEVVRSGFALGDHVLRPAQVVVARAPGAADEAV